MTEFFPDMSQFETEPPPEAPPISYASVMKIGTLQSRLETLLANIYTRKLSSHAVIKLANEVFGFNGWSSEIIECTLVSSSDEDGFSATYKAKVRVTLSDGTFCDGVSHGDAQKIPHKYMCCNTAKKHAISAGTKQALIGLPQLLLERDKLKER